MKVDLPNPLRVSFFVDSLVLSAKTMLKPEVKLTSLNVVRLEDTFLIIGFAPKCRFPR